MTENYLFFALNEDNDADKDAIMFPASGFKGAVSTNSTTLEFFFVDTERIDQNDDVSCTISTNNHKAVCNEFASLANGNRNNTNNLQL